MTLLNVEQLTVRLNVSTPTVYKLLKSGELRCVKIGGRKLVTEAELERFINERAEVVT